ncbi:arsinothricin resistance N-acetyltransferase ArsN1 family A [Parachitinimonas caeni]|uniref:Arsinothricin resistance N-acetyltransferase ArsN1 n=1 Tax=Parachitinimonas caeni TaxID=3031301 RepID=A0ABT7E2D1_9NEIS|nr:arsinothricin resistance N-acetyltransferase ArsN1 family A [Parachitinimonas caeni]MDK2126461.1 arsinothricin resistance N-acetyltransferase ArsN1 [Parachitinimonas caeni]
MQIRLATAADCAAIVAIYNQGIASRTATFETRPRTMSDIASWMEELDRYPVMVATLGSGEVAAWAGLGSYSPRECYAGIADFSIYVSNAHQGQGLGKPLLNALIDAAQQAGFWKVTSRVFADNEGSRRLCRACGFREVGLHLSHARIDGHWQDVVVVEKLIDANLVLI